MDRSSMLRRRAGRSGVMAESPRVASSDQYTPRPSDLSSAVVIRSKEALLKLNMPSPDAYVKTDETSLHLAGRSRAIPPGDLWGCSRCANGRIPDLLREIFMAYLRCISRLSLQIVLYIITVPFWVVVQWLYLFGSFLFWSVEHGS